MEMGFWRQGEMGWDADCDGEQMGSYTYSSTLAVILLSTRGLNHDVQSVERMFRCDSPCTLS